MEKREGATRVFEMFFFFSLNIRFLIPALFSSPGNSAVEKAGNFWLELERASNIFSRLLQAAPKSARARALVARCSVS